MRVGMGLIKNDHGVWHVRRKVPKALEEATATVMDVPKERVSWLKETLRTKDAQQAKVLAKPVMMKFDGAGHQTDAIDPETVIGAFPIDGPAIAFLAQLHQSR